ncbi:hypothetical protein ACFLRY_03385 [Bacteroidota bacterium]
MFGDTIYWGGFSLAFHDWTDPIERVLNKAKELNLAVTTPKIGEQLILNDMNFPAERWWEQYQTDNEN